MKQNLNPQELKISKAISLYLRHNPQGLKIKLDLDGWTDLDEFCNKISLKFRYEVTPSLIEELMNNSPKKRFEINLDKKIIRARYGHSVEISPSYELLTSPVALYHGTASTNKESILSNGLAPKTRLYVHASSDIELAILTAKRWSSEIVIFTINTKKMLLDGVKIYIAGEGIYLIKYVDSKYLTIV
jgi:putative RNA 2'-phosphotransferase